MKDSSATPATSAEPAVPVYLRTRFLFWAGLYGIALPAGALLIELFTNIWEETGGDMIPTPLHALFIASVPLSNLFLLLVLRGKISMSPACLSGLVGVAIAATIYYCLAICLVLHFLLLGLLYVVVGIGFLVFFPLSPYLAGIYLFRMMRFLTISGKGRLRTGIVAAACVCCILLSGGYALRHEMRLNALELASSRTPELAAEGEARLRELSNEAWLRRAASEPTAHVFASGSFASHIYKRPDVYYSMYGKTITKTDAELPQQYWYRRSTHMNGHEWIGWQRRTLQLASSAISGWADPDAGVAYVEWTQEFANHADEMDEARQHIQLPLGAVVSRVTLWVNGIPCEAAFDTVAKTRAAYEYYVERKRDPLLVNALVDDRLQVECFPIPAMTNGVPGTMKILLGISIPLEPDGLAAGGVTMPYILQQNFAFAEELDHQVAVKGLQPALGVRDRAINFAYTRNPEVREVVGFDPVTLAPVRARLVDPDSVDIRRVAVVIDGSATMAACREDLAAVFAPGAFGDAESQVWLAADRTASNATCILEAVPKPEVFFGGTHPQRALRMAHSWSLKGDGPGKVLWLSGPDAMYRSEMSEFVTDLEGSADRSELACVQMVPGANTLRRMLSDLQIAERVELKQPFSDQLTELVNRPLQVKAENRWKRDRVAEAGVDAKQHASKHLAILLAAEEIYTALADPHLSDEAHAALSAKAVAYEIVTPVSAAIVLESRAEYLKHGLIPPEDKAAGHSTIPEPNTLLLLMLGGGIMWLGRRFRREG